MRKFVILPLVVIWLSGCAATGLPFGQAKEFQEAAVFVKEKRYNEAIAAYRKIAAEAPGSKLAAEALFEIALVLTIHDNPQNDPIQAISEFEALLKRYPDNKRSHEAQNWISVLKTILELKKENEHLKKNIDQLKRLDIRHEERRNTR